MIRNCTYLLLIVLFAVSCGEEPAQQRAGFKKPKSERQLLMEATSDGNKMFNEEDQENIKIYLSNKDWDMKPTGSGMYYYITKSFDSTKAKTGDYVTLDYVVSGLDGTIYYNSEEDGSTSFTVDKQDMESGVHEAVKMLGVGDEGIFIIVNSRAHGVLGDSNKILPYQVLVYKLKLLGLDEK